MQQIAQQQGGNPREEFLVNPPTCILEKFSQFFSYSRPSHLAFTISLFLILFFILFVWGIKWDHPQHVAQRISSPIFGMCPIFFIFFTVRLKLGTLTQGKLFTPGR
jgi:hypothetical protein